MKISVVTATYNRAGYLNKLYSSLVHNISDEYNIEWLIMDDGSTDNTKEICSEFESKKNMEVKYFFQQNQGKMQAINNLSQYVTGDLWVECDSDDYFVENALKIIAEKCKMLPDNNKLYAIVFLKNENGESLSGNRFPFEGNNTKMFDLYFKNGVIGEKILVYNSSIRKKYKYIFEDDEKFCTESRMHHMMDLSYSVRCYNNVVIQGEYQADGYTKNIYKIFSENPKGHYMYFKEILQMDSSGVLLKKRLYTIKHYILFMTACNEKIQLKKIQGVINKVLVLLLYVPGRLVSKRKIKEWRKEI